MDRGNIIDSSDDEDVINFVAHLDQERRPKVIRFRPDNFQIWDNYDFFVRYRLKKDTVRRICNEIRDDISNATSWNSALTPEQMLLITLRFYATGSFLNAVGDLNGIHKSTVSRIVKRVSHAIAVLRPRYITFPTIYEVPEITRGFFYIASFPGVIDAIDCTHVKICSPGGNDAEIYRNRKGYFSLNVQAVCDYNLKFRNILSRWPGSAHDSHIFNSSYLRTQFEQQTFGENILLGDSGYRNRNYLLTPLLNPRTAAENLYNEAHIRTRSECYAGKHQWRKYTAR